LPAQRHFLSRTASCRSPLHKPRRDEMTTASGHTSAIRASKVMGTTVKDSAGDRIGEIEDIVLDKQSDTILFTVLSFGGVLGVGEKYYPVPWEALSYDESEDAYIVNLTKRELEAAPADSLEELTRDDGRPYREKAHQFYKVRVHRA
jgi:sporulation protein YlmC with PRC-barrel domain